MSMTYGWNSLDDHVKEVVRQAVGEQLRTYTENVEKVLKENKVLKLALDNLIGKVYQLELRLMPHTEEED